ncbi:MAG: glycosyltransferase family 9 protein [Candidatus Pacearchaeota archaeon]|jgi:heptosyltransferase-2|nr:hypothetical protein [Candidatus Pacearchaeota archaeon]MDP7521028.1 glycosyltransferase family 9 protein [Candidatus Pacearchaeota archaeon]|tara:strand:+ start:1973 stop:2863 length:891 start_codon:yes stop_codon:yes gene_type:complete
MKILIIKLGALGDVVRTTVLLSELIGEIYWLSKTNAGDLLNSSKISRKYFIESNKDLSKLQGEDFDLVISLDEEKEVLEIVKKIKTKRLIGVYLDSNENINYTKESSYWFDMSLSSKFGKKRADELKKENIKSVPQILIEMIGKRWRGQEYDIGIIPEKLEKVKGNIGLINICTGIWPNKAWNGYETLKRKLEETYRVKFLEIKGTLKEHIDEINNCELVVCGDTLGMHLALALKKKLVILFNCTPPQEIYGYNKAIKIPGPLLEKYLYKRSKDIEAISAIKVDDVYCRVIKYLKK